MLMTCIVERVINVVCRIGLVFVVNAEEQVDARHDVGVAVYRAFNYIMRHESAVKALSFLTDVRRFHTLHRNYVFACFKLTVIVVR